jgi:hypothetical protein
MVLAFSMDLLSRMEKHKTKSDRLESLAVKSTVMQTINTCFLYGILYMIHPVNPLGKFGLVAKMISFVIISGLINLFLCLFKPIENAQKCRERAKWD